MTQTKHYDLKKEIKRLRDDVYRLRKKIENKDRRIQALRNTIAELQQKLDICRERHHDHPPQILG